LHPFCTPFRQLESFSLRGCRDQLVAFAVDLLCSFQR
jgi:hypothetical protein